VNKRHPAQSLIEFALVVPLFLLLLFALVDFSRLLFTYVSLSNATREMARTAAVTTGWSATAPVDAFKNSALVADGHFNTLPPPTPADQVSVQWGDSACAKTRDAGNTCSQNTPVTCLLPSLNPCALVAPPQGGFVEVTTTYTFQFNPLFQTRLDGIIDVWFMRPTALITTTSRAYAE
jgi:Flp pilus assembly protein TadG